VSAPSSFSDAELLRVLDLRASGLPASKIAARMRRSKGQIVGVLYRIANETGPADRHDGTMPPGWWREGLKRQAAVIANAERFARERPANAKLREGRDA
jgi:hypothetical protein